MRIDGVRNFMMNAAPGTKFLPAQITNANKAADSFSISDAAQRLNMNLQKASKLAKAELTESLPAFGKEIDAKMKKAVNILERMKELTMLAQDESLGDDARVEIQIEIEDLRDNFMIIPYNIMSERQFSTQSQQYE